MSDHCTVDHSTLCFWHVLTFHKVLTQDLAMKHFNLIFFAFLHNQQTSEIKPGKFVMGIQSFQMAVLCLSLNWATAYCSRIVCPSVINLASYFWYQLSGAFMFGLSCFFCQVHGDCLIFDLDPVTQMTPTPEGNMFHNRSLQHCSTRSNSLYCHFDSNMYTPGLLLWFWLKVK